MMKRSFGHKTETSRIVLFLVFVALFVFGLWYLLLLRPVKSRMLNADTAEIEAEIETEKIRAAGIQSMKREIEQNKQAGTAIVPSYNNLKNEADELKHIFGNAYDFEFEFEAPVQKGKTVRRNVQVHCTAESFQQAVEMLEALSDGPYRGMIRDLDISGESENERGILDGPVKMAFRFTYFETTVDSKSTEGLMGQEDEVEE